MRLACNHIKIKVYGTGETGDIFTEKINIDKEVSGLILTKNLLLIPYSNAQILYCELVPFLDHDMVPLSFKFRREVQKLNFGLFQFWIPTVLFDWRLKI